MNRLLGWNKLYADITIPAALQACSNILNLREVQYDRRMNIDLAQELTELKWRRITDEIQGALNGEGTLASRNALAWRMQLIFYAVIPLLLGCAIGSMTLSLGVLNEDNALLSTGVVFIAFFILTLGFFIYNIKKSREAVQAMKTAVLQTLDGGVLDRLREQHLLLRFELVNVGKAGLVCTVRISLLEMPVAAVVETSTKESVATKYMV